MDSLFGAVLTQLPELEKNLLVAWLQVQGFVVKECTGKTWKDHPDSLRLFSKPTPEIAKELLDWSIEPILCGNFTKEEKENYKSKGVSFLWEKPYSEIHTFPSKTLPMSKLTWVVYTKDQNLDKHLSVFLKAMGQTVFTEGNLEFLIKRIQTGPCHFLILDWDVIDPRVTVPGLTKLKQEKQFLSLGIKDFMKEHLYRDLKTGIGTISEVLVSKSDFWDVLIQSFPLTEESKTGNGWTESIKPVSKLAFTFQEKHIPIGMYLAESTELKMTKTHPQIQNILDLFRWFS
ncbi:hypothetical protein EHQ68_09660 [Leptospira congkakensis]|uniref:Uncharacterized protein n=1 Tax=Leptospira congkakensis TaxID=2484932 RepID=A0A4Z1A5I2_9LEPT|nr:hypothetical protein [Leptospira congkakensis]TGL86021.1 hypothetical protein EHQ69_18255 [Leptospira congkakensis]TGL88895.1 hypothetical protein EHQ68_09660 [Leptospira congkakensis]TGL93397.1 hypothetical protein EHQ70_17825 [Leptospira congkakensis]